MTTRVNYMGSSHTRFISRANILALGLTDPLVDLVWNRQNSYERDVTDDVALYLLTQGDFATDPALDFGPLLAAITPGVELLSVEYTAADQSITGTAGADITGLTGMTPTPLGNRPVEIEIRVSKVRLTTASGPPNGFAIALYENTTIIDSYQSVPVTAAGTVLGQTGGHTMKCRRTAAQVAGKTYKVVFFPVTNGSVWLINSTSVGCKAFFKAA